MSDGAWEAEPGGGNGIEVVPSEESASAPVTDDNDAGTARRRIENCPALVEQGSTLRGGQSRSPCWTRQGAHVRKGMWPEPSLLRPPHGRYSEK